MAGHLTRIVPLHKLDFGNVPGSGSITQVLADCIDLSGWKEADLVVRIHNGTSMGVGLSWGFHMLGMDPACDDPASLFVTVNPIDPGGLSSTGQPTLPWMGLVSLSPNFGLMGRFTISVTQPAAAVAGVMWISADLVLKTDG